MINENGGDISLRVVNSVDDYMTCAEYIRVAGDAYSYYAGMLCVGYAHIYAKSALSSAKHTVQEIRRVRCM